MQSSIRSPEKTNPALKGGNVCSSLGKNSEVFSSLSPVQCRLIVSEAVCDLVSSRSRTRRSKCVLGL